MTATLSARLTRWYRVPLVLLFVAVAGAVGPARHASAEAMVASPSPGEPCQLNELDLSAPPNPVATVFAPGQVGTHQAILHNPTSVDFTDAYFVFYLTAPHAATAATTAPSTSWSIDGGDSPGMSFSWEGVPAPTSSFWRSGETALPALAAGSTHTLQFQVSFHADSPAGWYDTDLIISARACGITALGDTANMTYDFYTAGGRAGFGGQSSAPSGQSGGGNPASLPPTAPVSATPGAHSASPAATESVNTFVADTPSASATPTPNRASGASTAGPPKIAWLGGLVLLAAAALASLWRQVVNPGRIPGGARWRDRDRRIPPARPRTGIDDPTIDSADRNR